MATLTTIDDLPDDMLHEIFGRVFAAKGSPPEGAPPALRCVCRRWRDIADWEWLSASPIHVETSELADAVSVRVRHPAAFQALALLCSTDGPLPREWRAVANLINGSANPSRALLNLKLETCCLPSFSQVVTPIASCTALTRLGLFWGAHERESAVPSNLLAPLSALRMLCVLECGNDNRHEEWPADAGLDLDVLFAPQPALSPSAMLAPLPALPDAPSLTHLGLHMMGNFVPVGSDTALGRLRRLDLMHSAPEKELVDAEDPFLLRAAFDEGTWQPSRLTGLKELFVSLGPTLGDLRLPLPPSRSGVGSEWALLAGQVTKLSVEAKPYGFNRPSTGIVAGLGVLTALRDLHFKDCYRVGVDLVSIDRVHAPRLTRLDFNGACTPVNLDRFPNLVALDLTAVSDQPPLNLRSLVARSSLKRLVLIVRYLWTVFANLAELFVGGVGWPVLEYLRLENFVPEWDTTGLAGAPSAAEFAQRARQLLPALTSVFVLEMVNQDTLVDRSRAGFVATCRRHVVPALEGLHAGGG